MKAPSTTPAYVVLVLTLLGSLGGLLGILWKTKGNSSLSLELEKPRPAQTTSLVPKQSAPREEVATAVQEVADSLAPLRAVLESAADAVPGEVLLTFKDAAGLQRFINTARAQGLEWVSSLSGQPTGRFKYGSLEQLDRALRGSGEQPAVEPNRWLAVPQIPQEDKGNQGGAAAVGEKLLASIGAGGDRSSWGKGIKVAVLDTGIKAHPTFREGQLAHVDLVQDGVTPHSHGTSVASLIAGTDDQVPGVAPAAELLDVRVANEKGLSVTSLIAQGIYEAVDRGARVINISMGGESDSPMLRRAVEDAWARGAIVVAAAGNEKLTALAYPAAIPRVFSVGSVDGKGQQAYFSNSGQGLDLSAPGVGIIAAWDTDKLAHASGTSHSTGLVSGAIAAMLSQGYTVADVERVLKSWATQTGASADRVGAGVLNLKLGP